MRRRPVEWDRPALVISLDVELAWGIQDLADPSTIPFDRVPPLVERLLGLFDRHGVSATWAMVGHLLLDRCERDASGRAHPDMPRPRHSWVRDDWYARDPCTDAARSPEWYAPELARRIVAKNPRHDLGSHGFSHVLLGDPGCDRETAMAEMTAGRRLLLPVESAPVSFVYPRNSMGHMDALREVGFGICRTPDASWVEGMPGPIRKACRLVDALLPIAPPAVTPSVDDAGLVYLPGSMILMRGEGFRSHIPVSARVRKGVLGLENALRQGGIFHLWFHPWNLIENPDVPLDALEAILAHAVRLRDAGDMEILTMRDVFHAVSARG